MKKMAKVCMVKNAQNSQKQTFFFVAGSGGTSKQYSDHYISFKVSAQSI
jgi:hypothetical protein